MAYTNAQALALINEIKERCAKNLGVVFVKYQTRLFIRWYGSSQIFKVLIDDDVRFIVYESKDPLEIERFICMCS